MGASEVRAGKAYIEINGKDHLSATLNLLSRRLGAFGAVLQSIGIKVAGVGLGGLTAFGVAVKGFVSQGDGLAKMSARTGASVESLSQLAYAAELSGTSLEDLEGTLRHMQKTIGEAANGSKGAIESLGRLGVRANDLKGIAPDRQFEILGGRIAAIEDPTLRAAAAMDVFGKSGTGVLPMLDRGADGLRAMRMEADKLGLTISTEAAGQAAELNDQIDRLGKVAKNAAFWVGSALAGGVLDYTKKLTGAVVMTRDWIRQHEAFVRSAAKGAIYVAGAGLSLIGMGLGLRVAGAGLGVLARLTGTLLTSLNVKTWAIVGMAGVRALIGSLLAVLNPFVLIGAAITTGAALWIYYSGTGIAVLSWLRDRWVELGDIVSGVIGGMSDAMKSGDLELAAEIGLLGVKIVFLKITAELSAIWFSMIAGMKTTFVNLMADIQRLQNSIAGAIAGTMSRWKEGFNEASIQRSFNEKITVLMDDKSIPFEERKQRREALLKEAGEALQKNFVSGVKERGDIWAGLQGDLDDIERDRAKGLSDIDSDLAMQVGDATRAQSEAQRKLDELRRSAREGYLYNNMGPPAPGATNAPNFDDIGGMIAQAAAYSTAGTFGSGIGLGSSESAASQTARSTAEISKYTKKMSETLVAGDFWTT